MEKVKLKKDESIADIETEEDQDFLDESENN